MRSLGLPEAGDNVAREAALLMTRTDDVRGTVASVGAMVDEVDARARDSKYFI